MNYPAGWHKVSIGEVLGLINGCAFKPSDWSPTGTPIVRIQNLNNKTAPFNYYRGELPDKFKIENGDLLFAWSGTPGTSFGAHIWQGGPAWLNQHIFRVIFPPELFDKRFLQLALNQNLSEYVRAAHGAAGLAHITKGKFEASLLPLPPKKEQRRIVAKIEELFSELDKGNESLKQARAQLAVYRQALLKHAFEGKLTADWRKANAHKLESTDQLLARIQMEREARYQQQLADWKTAVQQWKSSNQAGSKPSKPRKPADVVPPTAEELARLPQMPAGWRWLRLGSNNVTVFDGPFGSNLKTSDYVAAGVRVVRLENIGALQFIEDKKSFISEEKYLGLTDHTVFPGDIVFSSFVTAQTRVALVPQSIKKAVNKSDCFCLRCHGSSLLNRYACTFLSTRFAFKQLEEVIHGVGRPRINTTQLKELFIPICSPAEQLAVVSAVEAQFSELDALESDIDTNLQKAEALRQSILKKAFAGELVPQDPADEPAALLARIRAERERAAEAPAKVGRALRARRSASQPSNPKPQSSHQPAAPLPEGEPRITHGFNRGANAPQSDRVLKGRLKHGMPG